MVRDKEWECEDTDPPAVASDVVPAEPVNVGATHVEPPVFPENVGVALVVFQEFPPVVPLKLCVCEGPVCV